MLIKYLQKGHTVTGHHYSGQLKCLREAIKKKDQESSQEESSSTKTMHQLTPPWFFMSTIHDCGFELATIHLTC